jgi:hypothetical protein
MANQDSANGRLSDGVIKKPAPEFAWLLLPSLLHSLNQPIAQSLNHSIPTESYHNVVTPFSPAPLYERRKTRVIDPRSSGGRHGIL